MTVVYTFDPEHKAYTGAIDVPRDVSYPPHHRSRTHVEPPVAKDGFARIWDKVTQTWSYVENHVGKTVYSKDTLQARPIKLGKVFYPTFGPIPDDYTDKAPPSQDHKWDEATNDWVVDQKKIDKREHDATPDGRIDIAFTVDDKDRVIFEALFELANDVRGLKGQQPITRVQLKDWLKAKLP